MDHTGLDTLVIEVEEVQTADVSEFWLPEGTPHLDGRNRIYWMYDPGAWLQYKGRDVPLETNHLYLLPAGMPFRYGASRPVRQFYIHFRATVFGGLNLLDVFPWEPAVAPDKTLTEYQAAVVTHLGTTNSPAATLMRQGILRQWLGLFLELDANQTLPTNMADIRRFHPVLAYIESHLDRPLKLEELAHVAHLQPNYFSNAFKKVVGLPPMQYLNKRRIDMAERMLADKNLTLAQIAEWVGLSDAFYFSRIFKKFRGISPSAFRKIQQNLP